MNKAIKIVLAILMFICLADMPYDYYEFVRFVALIGFGILAYEANKADQLNETIIFIALAILFQPIFKIPFGRNIWNAIDVLIGVGLILSMYNQKNKNKTN